MPFLQLSRLNYVRLERMWSDELATHAFVCYFRPLRLTLRPKHLSPRFSSFNLNNKKAELSWSQSQWKVQLRRFFRAIHYHRRSGFAPLCLFLRVQMCPHTDHTPSTEYAFSRVATCARHEAHFSFSLALFLLDVILGIRLRHSFGQRKWKRIEFRLATTLGDYGQIRFRHFSGTVYRRTIAKLDNLTQVTVKSWLNPSWSSIWESIGGKIWS